MSVEDHIPIAKCDIFFVFIDLDRNKDLLQTKDEETSFDKSPISTLSKPFLQLCILNLY